MRQRTGLVVPPVAKMKTDKLDTQQRAEQHQPTPVSTPAPSPRKKKPGQEDKQHQPTTPLPTPAQSPIKTPAPSPIMTPAPSPMKKPDQEDTPQSTPTGSKGVECTVVQDEEEPLEVGVRQNCMDYQALMEGGQL